jgi:hypothetical protein
LFHLANPKALRLAFGDGRSSPQPALLVKLREARLSRAGTEKDIIVAGALLEFDEVVLIFRVVAGLLIILTGEALDALDRLPECDQQEIGRLIFYGPKDPEPLVPGS